MVQVTEALAALSPDVVSLYSTSDPQLSDLPLFVFHGPSTTANSTLNSSRIQIHILSAAGYQSYPRLTISPNSPFYNVVNHLPREEQGDEICRGLAFGLLKYFKELPEIVKSTLIFQSAHCRGKSTSPTLFGEQHAADLASAMVKVDDIEQMIRGIDSALQPQSVSHVDVDLILPPGSITSPLEEQEEEMADDDDIEPALHQYGPYAPLVRLFGEATFLPTSKLRRAPSKPSSLNRSRSFLRGQKMSLRREMGEFVDTEGRYVLKLHELVNHIADDYRSTAKKRTFGSFSPSEQDLQMLFPSSLDKILQINSAFLTAIRKVMDETEEEAMKDLEADQVNYRGSRYGGSGRLKDPTGALAFAKVLLEWFPKFSDCYQDYIRSSQEFPKLISSFLKQPSSFSQRVQQTGEQRLRSAVIEPVQRLPRYSLFIDNIVKYLPVSHPALQAMLRARDIITTICSLDPPAADMPQVVNRLKTLIDGWPPNLLPRGRLISAVDYLELPAPYHISTSPESSSEGMLLLFADIIVVVCKNRESSLSARGIMAEIDRPSAATMMASVTAAANGQGYVYELTLIDWHVLSEIRFTESNQGRLVWMTSSHGVRDGDFVGGDNRSRASVHAFLLQGPYEGRGSRWTEEVTKARVEGRFSESERESEKWCLRNVNLKGANLNVYTAVFEEGIDRLVEGRKEPAPIRIVVDHWKGTKGAPIGHYGVEIIANVSTSESTKGSYGLEVGGLFDRLFVDSVDHTTFMPVFAKRVGDLIRAQYFPGNPSLTAAFISRFSALVSILQSEMDGDKGKPYRPSSPVKMLSSFLSGSGSIGSSSKHPRTPLMGNIPSILPAVMTRSNSQKGSDAIGESKDRVKPGSDENRASNPLVRLEETLIGYVAALHSRKGNISDKVLRARSFADELDVNALYNTFIENPFDIRASSDMPTDTLFCAFEKFLRLAWKEQMGPVVTLQTLRALQEKNVQLFPGDFADFIKAQFADMAPQNKRAFVAIIKLLAELLDSCGNDGDRGALTAAFASLLVPQGDPHDFINLLDRLVQDSDRLFEDIGPGVSTGYSTPMFGSMSSTTRSIRSANTGSLTSNASSIRKRFGFDTLLRQNSKTDSDQRPSMWRTLSKTTRNVATGEPTTASLSKVSLSRSRSTDTNHRIETPRRPLSRDRPTILGAFDFDERPSSSHMQSSRLSTIGASPPPDAPGTTKSLKNKRRSSLSDLKALMASTTLDSPSSQQPGYRTLPKPIELRSTPQSTSPTKSSTNDSVKYLEGLTQQKESIMNRTIKYQGDSPSQNENLPSTSRDFGRLTERANNIMSDDTMVMKESWSARKPASYKGTVSLSNIPTLNGALREHNFLQTSPTRLAGSPSKASPQKLRLQSPQKLRERLQNEAKAISAAEASLQSELLKIGDEMAKLNKRAEPPRSALADLEGISSNLKTLESKIPILIKDLSARNNAIQRDMEKGLQASEAKVKGLDQLYKESSAENELLYEKFNGELGKIIKALRGKGREDKEELITKVKEATEETARIKKENVKLRREMISLRSLLKASE
ncbi:MAG: hypothetical protein M1818_004269 [Claussenomyces sp. TS43310]|nr:MAG: hypothetical protein M1818_004269 [Claussenomyces sp. TS43310]